MCGGRKVREGNGREAWEESEEERRGETLLPVCACLPKQIKAR